MVDWEVGWKVARNDDLDEGDEDGPEVGGSGSKCTLANPVALSKMTNISPALVRLEGLVHQAPTMISPQPSLFISPVELTE